MATEWFAFQSLMVKVEGPRHDIDRFLESVEVGEGVEELEERAKSSQFVTVEVYPE